MVSEKTSSGGLPRVIEAVKEYEMSLQSAQGSLKHLTEQESLEEISEHGMEKLYWHNSSSITNIQFSFGGLLIKI
jgi:hypothetical protein